MASLVLGIDTGGTYTDGVLMDQSSKRIIKTAKTLTTRPDLARGILAALDDLLPDDLSRIKLVVISTTLATNAIAEGKGKPVGLFLLGYDPDLVGRFNLQERFAAASHHFFQGGHDLYANPQAPLDLNGILKTAGEIQDQVDAFAVSGYFSPFNASHEETVFENLQNNFPHPVVLGHELSTRLNSIQRATTACLNAALLHHLQTFIQAMAEALVAREIQAPLLVVRGDGALVPASQAESRPVETVHSGPAASAIGGRFLAEKDRALVIDIGGTTTDIALIDGGRVQIQEQGTTVGDYQTAVRAARIHSLGLGGDSWIQLDLENQLQIGPSRVQPLCALAETHPDVVRELKRLAADARKMPHPRDLEFWYLIQRPSRTVSDGRARQVLRLLEERPRRLPEILEILDVFHPLQTGATALIREEIIGVSALTPTDLFHVRGDFTPWNQEAAALAAELLAGALGLEPLELAQKVLQQMALRITRETITYLSGQSLEPAPFYIQPDDLGWWLFEENARGDNPYLGCEIRLKIPLVGIGAPASLILPAVADLLHTDYIAPEHFQVANAVGAAVGSLVTSREAWVIPQSRNDRTVGFYVQVGSERKRFRTLEEALEFAETQTTLVVEEQARDLGITQPRVELEHLPAGAESFLIRGVAVGQPLISPDLD